MAMVNVEIGGKPSYNEIYSLNCSQVDAMPDVSLTIHGTTFKVTPATYVGRYKVTCWSLLVPRALPSDDGSEVWSIGEPFLFGHTTVFDLERRAVGFAPVEAI
jgi:hypothetical protein